MIVKNESRLIIPWISEDVEDLRRDLRSEARSASGGYE
jgi:hypothetical protein